MLPPGLCEGPSSLSIEKSNEVFLWLFLGHDASEFVLPPGLCEGLSSLSIEQSGEVFLCLFWGA